MSNVSIITLRASLCKCIPRRKNLIGVTSSKAIKVVTEINLFSKRGFLVDTIVKFPILKVYHNSSSSLRDLYQPNHVACFFAHYLHIYMRHLHWAVLHYHWSRESGPIPVKIWPIFKWLVDFFLKLTLMGATKTHSKFGLKILTPSHSFPPPKLLFFAMVKVLLWMIRDSKWYVKRV